MRQLESALDVCKEEVALYLSQSQENKEIFENQLKKKSEEVTACFNNSSLLQRTLVMNDLIEKLVCEIRYKTQQKLWIGSKLGKDCTFCEGKGENYN